MKYYAWPQFTCGACQSDIFTDPVYVPGRKRPLCPTCAVKREADRDSAARNSKRRKNGRGHHINVNPAAAKAYRQKDKQ